MLFFIYKIKQKNDCSSRKYFIDFIVHILIRIAKEIEITENGLEKYPKEGILFSNIVMLLWFALGTIACWYFYPLAAWIYLAFALIIFYIVLRKVV
jgi:hypothetical protein